VSRQLRQRVSCVRVPHISSSNTYRKVAVVVVVGVVVVRGPERGCTAACRLIVHTPCVINVPTFTARRLHVTTTLEILAAKGGTRWTRNVPVIWPKVASSTLL
jgi:hypothetical protein